MRISLKTVYSACRSQNVQSPPLDIAIGVFNFIREVGGTNIYYYHIKEVKGCRNVHADFHGKLPPPKIECCTSIQLLIYRNHDKSGVGNIVNREDGVTLVAAFEDTEDTGKVCSNYKQAESIPRGLEIDIQKALHEYLNQSILTDGDCKAVIIHAQQADDHNLCEFKGGGDILLDYCGGGGGDRSQTIMTLGGAYGVNEDEDEDSSPVYEDEVRVGSKIELKHRPMGLTEHDIEFQLRANMILGMSKELYKLLEEDSLANLRKLNTMSMYGITFGYRSPLMILKLNVSFTNQTTETSLRYKELNSHSWAIDASICYVYSRMKAKSSNCPTPVPTPVPTPEPD